MGDSQILKIGIRNKELLNCISKDDYQIVEKLYESIDIIYTKLVDYHKIEV